MENKIIRGEEDLNTLVKEIGENIGNRNAQKSFFDKTWGGGTPTEYPCIIVYEENRDYVDYTFIYQNENIKII